MNRDQAVAAFETLVATTKDRTKMGQFRELFDLVDRAASSGVRQPAIRATLASLGLDLSLRTLSNYLSRVRRERSSEPASAGQPPSRVTQSTAASPSVGSTTHPATASTSNPQAKTVAPPHRSLEEVLGSPLNIFDLEAEGQAYLRKQRDEAADLRAKERAAKRAAETAALLAGLPPKSSV